MRAKTVGVATSDKVREIESAPMTRNGKGLQPVGPGPTPLAMRTAGASRLRTHSSKTF